jgi:hypothetical protein
MDTSGLTSRLERQHARAGRNALSQRCGHATLEIDQAPGPPRTLVFPLADLLPPERVLFLRIFSGTTAFSRRRAVRAWQHMLRAKREHAHAGTNDSSPAPVHDERVTAMTAQARSYAGRHWAIRPPGSTSSWRRSD